MKQLSVRMSGAGLFLTLLFASVPARSSNTSTPCTGARAYRCCFRLLEGHGREGETVLVSPHPVRGMEDSTITIRRDSSFRDPGNLLINSSRGTSWQLFEFFRTSGYITDSIYFLPSENVLVVTRKLSRFGQNMVLFEVWQKEGPQRFVRRMRVGALPYGSTLINHLPDKRMLLLGTSQGRFFLIDLERFEVTHVINPPPVEHDDLAYAAELSRDGTSLAVFHEHRLIEYELMKNKGPSPNNVRGVTHLVNVGSYPTAHARAGEYLVWGDSQGRITFRQFRSRLALVKVEIADLISREEMTLSGEPIIEDITHDDQTGMLMVSVAGAKRVIRVKPPPSLRAGGSEINPLFWQKGTRFDLRNVAEDVLLGKRLFFPDYNAVGAAAELRLKRVEYALHIAQIQAGLRISGVAEPTEADAFRVLAYSVRRRTPLSALVPFLANRSLALIELLDRTDIWGSVLHILEVAEGRTASPAVVFNQVEAEIDDLLFALATFKAQPPVHVVNRVAQRLSEDENVFWYSLIKLKEMGLIGDDFVGFWRFLSFLLSDRHPIEDRPLTLQEVVEAAHGSLFFSKVLGDGTRENTKVWLKQLKTTMREFSFQTQTGKIERPTFLQAERLLRLHRAAGDKWDGLIRSETLELQRAPHLSLEHLISVLENRQSERSRTSRGD